MDIKEFTFSGFINFDWSDDFETIKLTDEDKSIDLVKEFRAIFDQFGGEVSVSYFTSENKKTEEEIKEGWLRELFGGITAKHEERGYCYSSYTYGTEYNTYLKIGGHDLFHELGGENNGKWCVLKINVKTE